MSEQLHSHYSSAQEYYFGRVSVDVTTELLREQDGLRPGQIALSRELNELPDDVRPILIKCFPAMPEVVEEAIENESLNDFVELFVTWFEFDMGDNDELDDLRFECEKKLHELVGVGVAVAQAKFRLGPDEIPEKIDRKKQPLDEQYRVLHDLVDEFMDQYPEMEVDMHQPGSVAGLSAFADYYKQYVHERLGSNELLDTLVAHRQSLVAAMKTPTMQHHLGKASTMRIAEHIADQPLVVVDPLSTIRAFGQGTVEPLGWFSPNKRLCYIDVLAIRKTAQFTDVLDNAGTNNDLFEVALLEVMAHEFLHSVTDSVYRFKGSDAILRSGRQEYSEIKAKSIWPTFVKEAIVEKAAYMWALTANQELFNKARAGWIKPGKEGDLRTYRSDNPSELLAPKYVQEMRRFIPSIYVDYRIVLDTIMEKVDWARAGINRKQADRMIIDAFFDRTDNVASQDSTARKRFMQALHQATHTGFLAKTGQLVDQYGAYCVLNMLESPHFDYSSPDDLQVIAWPHVRTHLQRLVNKQERHRDALSRLEELNAPDSIKEYHQKSLERSQRAAEDMDVLVAATRGLSAVMADKYGVRERHINPTEMLHRAIFGGQLKKTNLRSVEVKDLPMHTAAVRDWKSLADQRKGTWFQ